MLCAKCLQTQTGVILTADDFPMLLDPMQAKGQPVVCGKTTICSIFDAIWCLVCSITNSLVLWLLWPILLGCTASSDVVFGGTTQHEITYCWRNLISDGLSECADPVAATLIGETAHLNHQCLGTCSYMMGLPCLGNWRCKVYRTVDCWDRILFYFKCSSWDNIHQPASVLHEISSTQVHLYLWRQQCVYQVGKQCHLQPRVSKEHWHKKHFAH